MSWAAVLAMVSLVACGGNPAHPDGGGAVTGACSDLFQADALRTYSVEIDPAEWQSLDAEFHNVDALVAGNDFAVYHPIVFHLNIGPDL